MKKLLALLFSFFLLSSHSVFAEDLSDFQIEGMSIGDSLLDYMSEDEILSVIERTKNNYGWLNEPNKYSEVYMWEEFPTYDNISFFIKNNLTNQYVTNKNEKYTILFIRGMVYYIEDFDSCIEKRDGIVEVLSGMFPNANKSNHTYAPSSEPSGDSIKSDVIFVFKSKDRIEVSCENYEENYRIKNHFTEGLNIVIHSAEIAEWLKNNNWPALYENE